MHFYFPECKEMSLSWFGEAVLADLMIDAVVRPFFDYQVLMTNNEAEYTEKDRRLVELLTQLGFNTVRPLFEANHYIRIRHVELDTPEGAQVLQHFGLNNTSFQTQNQTILRADDNKKFLIPNGEAYRNYPMGHGLVADLIEHLKSYDQFTHTEQPYFIERTGEQQAVSPVPSPVPSPSSSIPRVPSAPSSGPRVPSQPSSSQRRIIPARVTAVATDVVQQKNLLMSCVEKCYQDYNLTVPDIVREGIIGLPSTGVMDALDIRRIHRDDDDDDDEDAPVIPPIVGPINQQLNLPDDINVTFEGHERCKKMTGKQVSAVIKAMIALHQRRAEKVTGPVIIEYLLANNLVRTYHTARMPEAIKNLGPEYFVVKVPENLQPRIQPNTNENGEIDRWAAHQQNVDKDLKRRLQTSVARALTYVKNKDCAVSTARGVYKYNAV